MPVCCCFCSFFLLFFFINFNVTFVFLLLYYIFLSVHLNVVFFMIDVVMFLYESCIHLDTGDALFFSFDASSAACNHKFVCVNMNIHKQNIMQLAFRSCHGLRERKLSDVRRILGVSVESNDETTMNLDKAVKQQLKDTAETFPMGDIERQVANQVLTFFDFFYGIFISLFFYSFYILSRIFS